MGAERARQLETHQGALVGAVAEGIGQQTERWVAVQVVAVGHTERSIQHIGACGHGMGGAPRTGSGRPGEVLADRYHLHAGHVGVGRCQQTFLHLGAGHQNQALDSGSCRRRGGDGKDRFVVGTNRFKLLGAAEAGSQPGGQQDQ